MKYHREQQRLQPVQVVLIAFGGVSLVGAEGDQTAESFTTHSFRTLAQSCCVAPRRCSTSSEPARSRLRSAVGPMVAAPFGSSLIDIQLWLGMVAFRAFVLHLGLS